MIEDVLTTLREKFGEEWSENAEANLRFSVDAENVMGEVDGIHLIGSPEFDDGTIRFNCWVDYPIADLFEADEIAYEVFGKISEQFFCSQRVINEKHVIYRFVTGSERHGHAGELVFVGPHAAEFVDRHNIRTKGDVRFHA